MSLTMVKCPTCEGTCKMNCVVHEAGKPEQSFTMNCHVCEGKGEVTEEHAELIQIENDMWCDCDEPSEDRKYWPDGTHPVCHKHCWSCTICGKIVQIG